MASYAPLIALSTPLTPLNSIRSPLGHERMVPLLDFPIICAVIRLCSLQKSYLALKMTNFKACIGGTD